MLYLTSFGAGLGSFYATVQGEHLMGFLSMLMYGVCVLHHANYTGTDYLGGPWIAQFDRLLAKFNYVVFVYKTAQLPLSMGSLWVWATIVATPWMYFCKINNTPYVPYVPYVICETTKWHALLHVMNTIAILVYAYEAGRRQVSVHGFCAKQPKS